MQSNTKKKKKKKKQLSKKRGIKLIQVRLRKTIRVNCIKVNFKINHMFQTKISATLWSRLK